MPGPARGNERIGKPEPAQSYCATVEKNGVDLVPSGLDAIGRGVLKIAFFLRKGPSIN
jgi:hypothetical protein